MSGNSILFAAIVGLDSRVIPQPGVKDRGRPASNAVALLPGEASR